MIAGARWLAGSCIALVACARDRGTLPANTADAGIAIAIYDLAGHAPYGVVSDRRWVEIDGAALVLDRVDPRAVLPSLVIEPLTGAPLEIGACARDRLPGLAPSPDRASAEVAPATPADGAAAFAPVLRCAIRGARGRHLVRLHYVVPELGYRAAHDLAMTAAGRAIVVSRFSIATPAWLRRAELTLYDGMPGTAQPPREIARGPTTLDGGIAVLATSPRTVPAQLRRIYDGAVHKRSEVGPRDPRWQRESHSAVWVWLELQDAALAPGPVRAHVQLAGEPTRDIDVPALGRSSLAGAVGLPLWIDDDLRGRRDRWSQSREDATLIDRFAVSLANLGATAREVWIEETLRPARSRTVLHAWPIAAEVVKARLRIKLTVAAGKIARAGFEVEYDL